MPRDVMPADEYAAALASIHGTRRNRLLAEAEHARPASLNAFSQERERYQGTRVTPATYMYPDYFSATSQWGKALAAVPVVDWVIINPASGPGTEPNSDYQAQAVRAHAAGSLVMGYVSTAWATVDPASVREQIGRHLAWYDVDGIFLDETVTGWDGIEANLAYYEALHTWASVAHPGLIITTNPGAASTPRIVGASDMLVAFENTAAVYLSTADADITPAHYRTEPRSKFWHLIHSVTDQAQAEAVLAKSKRLHAGHIYLTDDVMGNPWDRLPADWLWELQVQHAAAPAPNPNLGRRSVPATATSPGTAGEVAYDAAYVYLCVAANTWRRAALAAW